MKKILLICLTSGMVLILGGCETPAHKERMKLQSPQISPEGAMVAVYRYQGCEYLKFDPHYHQSAIHSETCPNPKHLKE